MSRSPDNDFLAAMAHSSRQRVAQARTSVPEGDLQSRARGLPPPPPLRLSPGGFDLIAEVKLRSPAAGVLKGGAENVAARVSGYADAGAAAISVLTEPTSFDGTLSHLTAASDALAGRIPVMRKDFLVDPYQVYEARVAGAGGILVILRMLTPAAVRSLLDAAAALGLFVLLEAFDAADLTSAAGLVERYAARMVLLVGVNCRDLTSLEVVPGRLEQLAAQLPQAVARVAESGVATGEDAARVAAAGYNVALVGSALMQSDDPRTLTHALLSAGRAAVRLRCG